MKITTEFISKLNVPQSAWAFEMVENRPLYTIRNPRWCNVFWVELWDQVLQPMFKDQQMVPRVENVDVTLPILVTEQLELISAQPIVESIVYYWNLKTNISDKPKLQINFTMFQILVVVIVLFVVVGSVSIFVPAVYKNINVNQV